MHGVKLCTDMNDMIKRVFGIHLQYANGDRAILAATNAVCDEINTKCLDKIHGAEKTYYSFNEVSEKESTWASCLTQEFLQGLNFGGFPPHELKLKVGAQVMVLRNLNRKAGLLNGTRLRIIHLFERAVAGVIITEGQFKGKNVIVPRIPLLINTELPYSLIRRQLPLRLAYGISINKSQCQSLEQIGLYVNDENDIFTHGQLYVALSRVTQGAEGLHVLDKEVTNVVYEEIFFDEEADNDHHNEQD